MRKYSLLLVILLTGYNPLTAQTLQRVSVKGNKFINEKGDTLIFRGLNSSDPDKLANDGQWGTKYFDEVKKWGANIIRFPVHPTAWRKRGQKEYIKLLDQGIALAKERGIYVIIDWHS